MGQPACRFQTVLVVDDDERVLAAFERSIKGAARRVLTATTSAAALAAARREGPDLAIVDLQLGSESGIEVIRALKQSSPAIVAVLISGYASVQTTVLAMRAGADDVLAKPITWSEMLYRLDGCAGQPPPSDTPTLARVQWEHVSRVLSDCDGNVSLTARKLGIDRSTLQRWLRRQAPSA